MDVVGVVTPLVRGGAQVVLHGDQVVETQCAARGARERRSGKRTVKIRSKVEREEGEVKEKPPHV